MEGTAVVALRSTAEEAMVGQEVVRQMHVLAEAGWALSASRTRWW